MVEFSKSMPLAERYRVFSDMLGKEPEIGSVLVQLHRLRAVEDELLRTVSQDPQLTPIIAQYQLGIEDLRKIYRALLENGADVWMGETYLPVMALVRPASLEHILNDLHQRKKMSHADWSNLISDLRRGDILA